MKKVKKPLIIQDEKILQALGLYFYFFSSGTKCFYWVTLISAILRGSCKIPAREWKRAILEVDEKTLDPNTLQQLRNALPPVELLNQLKEVAGTSLEEMPEGEQVLIYFKSGHFVVLNSSSLCLALQNEFTVQESGALLIFYGSCLKMEI